MSVYSHFLDDIKNLFLSVVPPAPKQVSGSFLLNGDLPYLKDPLRNKLIIRRGKKLLM